MNIKPLSDKVVVKKLEAQEKTKSGNEVKMQVSVGQKVIIRDYAGTTVNIEDEEYIIVRQDDIVAIVED